MADLVANIAKGRHIHYASVVEAGANDEGLVLILLAASGLVDDDTLQDYDTVAAMLAGPSSELSGTGYERRVLSNVTVTVDDTGNTASFTADPEDYTITGSSPQAGKAVIAFDPDTTGGDDTDLVPLVLLDCAVTFDDGVKVTLTPHADGLAVVESPS